MVHEPALGAPLQELGSAVRYRTGLADRVREIAILAVAAATGCAFEQYAHARVGRAAGLDDDELAALDEGRFSSVRPGRGGGVRLLPAAARRPVPAHRHRVRRLRTTLGTTTITELVVLVGYYRTLAQLLDVYDVGVPADEAAQ